MKLLLSEQDLIDACCVFASDALRSPAEQIQADVQFVEDEGIFAEARSHAGSLRLSEQDVIDGVALMLARTQNLDPGDLLIDLFYEDGLGLGARVEVTGS
jgi:Protein of unknown function (DUF2653)